jgi:hypothetical protein
VGLPYSGTKSVRRIANRLIDAAETGDLPSIRELIDCIDGKATQVIDQGQMTVMQLSDSQLNEMAVRGLTEMNLVRPASRRRACMASQITVADDTGMSPARNTLSGESAAGVSVVRPSLGPLALKTASAG